MRSVWTLPVDEITAADLKTFLEHNTPEGPQLDYKQSLETSISKNIAAFANTVGGLIVFGVKTDSANKPILPARGIPAKDWNADQLNQICANAINPAMLPNVSGPIKNPYDKVGEDTVLAVLRVDQSVAAPHAINQSTSVPVRVNDMSKRFDVADIDRIAFMLKQRERFEEFRATSLKRNLDRLPRITPPLSAGFPVFWLNFAPEFAWRPVTTDDKCQFFLDIGDASLRRGPRGAIGTESKKRRIAHEDQHEYVALVSVENNGTIFRGKVMCSATFNGLYLSLNEFGSDAKKFFYHCQHFYRREDVQHPGLVRLSIGVERVAGMAMAYEGINSAVCFDASFSTERTMSYEKFNSLPLNESELTGEVREMIRELGHAFGLEVPNPPR